jgi:hypothetical protein
MSATAKALLNHFTTTVIENPAIGSLRIFALGLMPKLDWRHHGIGVLQGYVAEECNPEVRVHIWSRRLLKAGMDISGDIHDHRFSMISHVLIGKVNHVEIHAEPDPCGDHAMLALTNARAAKETNYHGPTRPLEGFYSLTRKPFTITEGYSYVFPSGRFHRSPLEVGDDDIAVTVIEKHGQLATAARILHPISRTPIMAFGHEPDEALIDDVIAQATALLQTAARIRP